MSYPRSYIYHIDHEGLILEVTLIETKKLMLHEQTIPKNLDALITEIKRDGFLKAPVIVDRNSYVVLDGMHRVAALKDMGCRFSCVCFVDYKDPRIKVDRWCRTVSNSLDRENIFTLIKKIGFKPQKVKPLNEIFGFDSTLLLFKDRIYKLDLEGKLLDTFKKIYEFELLLEEENKYIGYQSGPYASKLLNQGIIEAVVCPPKISKEKVIEISKKSQLFIPKATRHILPARPLGVNVPISLLNDSKLSAIEANNRLYELLNKKRLVKTPSGTRWNGRNYDEILYIFKD